MIDWQDAVRKYLMEQSASEQPGTDTPVAPYPDDFVGPKQPVGPEYRPDLLKTSPTVDLQIGDIQSQASSAPKPTGPMGPEYRPNLLGIEQPQPQAQPAAPQMQRSAPESAPYDNSAWYAALRDMANAGGLAKSMGMEPGLAYYDTKLAQEKQKQKDWKDQLALRLKQQFEQDQQGREFAFKGKEGGLDRDLRKTEAEARREDAKASRALTEAGQKQADRHFWANYNRMGKQFDESQKSVQGRADADDARVVSEKLPSPAAFAAGQNVKRLLASGQTPAGFGKVMNAVAKLGIPLGQLGASAGEILRQANLSPEESKQWNDAYALTMLTAFDLGGKALTEGEKEPIELMAGIRGGQGPEVLKHGLLRMIKAQEEKVKRGYSVLNPGGQARLRKMGFSPETWGEPPPDEDLVPDGGR